MERFNILIKGSNVLCTKMAKRLIEAVQKGDVHGMLSLFKDDPFLLKTAPLSVGETPLHIACRGSSLDVFKELLNLRPEFAKDLDHEGFSPLHIAAVNGDLEIVKELLKMDSNLCMVKGDGRRIPLHYAVMKGRIEVIRELLSACEDSIRELTARGETSLHLAVKIKQFEAFKNLIEYLKTYDKEDILNKKDAQGNTVLHLAASRKQYEVVELLLDEHFVDKDRLELNSLSKRGLTPLDLLLSEGGDCEIEEMLRLAGASGSETMNSGQQPTQRENRIVISQDASANELRIENPRKPSEKLSYYFKYDKTKDTPSNVRSTLLTVAVLIATATYQAVLNPPGGLWQDDLGASNTTTTNGTVKQLPAHTAGTSMLVTKNPYSFSFFLLFNSIGFYMALHMLFFLTMKFPLRLELHVSIIALSATYGTSMGAIIPFGKIVIFFIIISTCLPFMFAYLTRLARDYYKRPRSVSPSPSTQVSA